MRPRLIQFCASHSQYREELDQYKQLHADHRAAKLALLRDKFVGARAALREEQPPVQQVGSSMAAVRELHLAVVQKHAGAAARQADITASVDAATAADAAAEAAVAPAGVQRPSTKTSDSHAGMLAGAFSTAASIAPAAPHAASEAPAAAAAAVAGHGTAAPAAPAGMHPGAVPPVV